MPDGIPIELIRTSFFVVGVYGDYFGLSRDILHLFYIEKQGLAMRLGTECGASAALLRNQLTF